MSDKPTWEQRWQRDGSRWRYIYELEVMAEQVPVLRRLLIFSLFANVMAAIDLLSRGI